MRYGSKAFKLATKLVENKGWCWMAGMSACINPGNVRGYSMYSIILGDDPNGIAPHNVPEGAIPDLDSPTTWGPILMLLIHHKQDVLLEGKMNGSDVGEVLAEQLIEFWNKQQ